MTCQILRNSHDFLFIHISFFYSLLFHYKRITDWTFIVSSVAISLSGFSLFFLCLFYQESIIFVCIIDVLSLLGSFCSGHTHTTHSNLFDCYCNAENIKAIHTCTCGSNGFMVLFINVCTMSSTVFVKIFSVFFLFFKMLSLLFC